jgi:hypothetical protein
MTRLLAMLILTIAFVVSHSAAAQAGKVQVSEATPKANAESQSAEEKRLNREPVITIKADRETIYRLLASHMQEQGFRLLKKDNEVMVFDQRVGGAAAAIRRRSFDHSTTTPIVDDPRTIMAFGITRTKTAYMVVGRFVKTTVVMSEVSSRDLTAQKEGRINLNRALEKLKSAAERESGTTK